MQKRAPARGAVPRGRLILRGAAIAVSAIPLAPPTPQSFGRWGARRTGGVAQLGERLLCKQEVIGSIPFTSTISLGLMVCRGSRGSDGQCARHESERAQDGAASRDGLLNDRGSIQFAAGFGLRQCSLTG